LGHVSSRLADMAQGVAGLRGAAAQGARRGRDRDSPAGNPRRCWKGRRASLVGRPLPVG